ncbi:MULTISPECIES: hypothetical protein [Streptosporangium]|uniref:DUF1453 domain-containing protein n=1 Tax=Streptosporangium brasiliense TaxID=47480 RepID=A0ABT9R5W7_9ACTN|nr:hypothetical protein [Streptosporangium brasiliense]MDP9864533.1 hypothetical protein [Streptosporangium brasiliense]
MDGTLWVAVVAVLVLGVVVKRFIGEPLNARDLFLPPVVLIGIGVFGLARNVHPSGYDIVWIAAASLIGLLFGALRGLTPRLFTKHGHLWQRYTVWTLLVWAVSAAANMGVGLLAVAAGVPEQARPITLSIGVSLLGEAITLGLRALNTGTPFAPETPSPLDRVLRLTTHPAGTARTPDHTPDHHEGSPTARRPSPRTGPPGRCG